MNKIQDAAWENEWNMSFRVDIYVVVYFNSKNLCFTYELNGSIIPDANRITNMGILIDKRLWIFKNCYVVVKKSTRVVCFILENVSSRSLKVIVLHPRGLVHPRLEYAVNV